MINVPACFCALRFALCQDNIKKLYTDFTRLHADKERQVATANLIESSLDREEGAVQALRPEVLPEVFVHALVEPVPVSVLEPIVSFVVASLQY